MSKRLQIAFVLILVIAITTNAALLKPKRKRKNAPNNFVPQSKDDFCFEGICNHTINYPKHLLSRLLASNKNFDQYAGIVIRPFEKPTITARWPGAENTQENMCKTREYLMFPQMARNINFERKFIVQVGKFKQAVHFEACEPGATCFANQFIPNNYITTCKQKNVAIKLLTLHYNGTISHDYYPIPGGCVCTYSRTTYLDD